MAARTAASRPRNRRRRPLGLAGGAVLLAAGLLAVAWLVPLLSQEGVEFVVTYSQGKGTVISEDRGTTELVEGSPIRAGDRIVTHSDGAAILTSETGHTLTMMDSAELVVEGTRRTLLGNRLHTDLRLERGEATVSGESPGHTSLDIGLPNGTAGVRGTELTVRAGDGMGGNAVDAVSLYEGALEVSGRSGGTVDLDPGEGAALAPDGAEVVDLPAPPFPRPLADELSPVRDPDARIGWDEVYRAVAYRVSWATDSTFQRILRRDFTEETELAVPLVETRGSLFFRVQGVTREGLLGLPSEVVRVEISPRWAEGLRLRESGDLEAATAELSAALDRFPASAALRRDLAWTYYLMGDHEAALGEYRAAREVQPANPEIRMEMARVQFWLEEYDEAEAIYSELLAQNSDNADALWGLGDLYRVQGRTADAVRLLERAIQVDPDHPYARQSLRNIRSGG